MPALLAVIGALLRAEFGGTPLHTPRWLVYTLMIVLGYRCLGGFYLHGDALYSALLVSIAVAAGFSPGHGSYLHPGNGSPDNEFIAPLVRLLSLWPEGSVDYCCIGMGLRYGLATCAAAIVMLGCDIWLHAHFSLWFAAVGFLCGPIMFALAKAHWERWKVGSYIDPTTANRPFELLLGLTIYGGLALIQ